MFGILAAVAGAILVVFLWWNRSVLFVAAAHRAFQRHDLDATFLNFDRAERAGRLGSNATASYAYLLLKEGHIDEAETLIDRALEKGRKGKPLADREKHLLQSSRALVLWKRDRLDEAAALLEELLANGYRTTTVYGSLGYFLVVQERWERAEEVCREALEWDPNGKVIADNWGAFLIARERWEEADAVYNTLLEREPRFPEAWYNGGLAAEKRGRPEVARERYERALQGSFHALTTLEKSVVEKALERVQDSSSDQRS